MRRLAFRVPRNILRNIRFALLGFDTKKLAALLERAARGQPNEGNGANCGRAAAAVDYGLAGSGRPCGAATIPRSRCLLKSSRGRLPLKLELFSW